MRTNKITDATLTKTQKNAALDCILAAGFDAADFEWSEVNLGESYMGGVAPYGVSCLTHSSTEYYFAFGHSSVKYSPGQRSKVERDYDVNSWNVKFDHF